MGVGEHMWFFLCLFAMPPVYILLPLSYLLYLKTLVVYSLRVSELVPKNITYENPVNELEEWNVPQYQP